MDYKLKTELTKLFEVGLETPQPPVQSAMQGAITQQVRRIFDDPSLQKYKTATNEDAENIIQKNPEKIKGEATKVLNELRKVNSLDTEKMKASGVSKKTSMFIKKIQEQAGITDPQVAKQASKEMITAFLAIMLDTKLAPEEKAKRGRRALVTTARKWNIPEAMANAIFVILNDDSGFDVDMIAKKIQGGIPGTTPPGTPPGR